MGRNRVSLQNPKKKPLNDYARYSGMAFQMLAIILVGIYGGKKLDEWLHTGSRVFTLSFALISVVGAMYLMIKDVLKNNKPD
jgi:ATP synthase protein I